MSLAHPPGRPRVVVRDRHRDSTQWDGFRPRPNDIVIASCYRAGTTLTQQIVHLLARGTDDYDRMRNVSPWVDSRVLYPGPALVESLPSPRFLKSHLPFSALPQHATWRYIYLVRDGRDVGLSLYEQCRSLAVDRPLDDEGNPFDYGSPDFSRFWDEWLENGHPYWPLWDHIDDWWHARTLPNVLLLHFDALVADKPAHVRRIADFLGLPLTPALERTVCERSSLAHMKGLELAGKLGKPGPKDATTFVNAGVRGRWRGRLTAAQNEAYLSQLTIRLSPACAAWVRSE